MEQWIRETFGIVPLAWENADGSRADAFSFESGGSIVTVPVSFFVKSFGPEAPTSAAQLKAKDPDNTLGWHQHFDAWVAKGIIPAE